MNSTVVSLRSWLVGLGDDELRRLMAQHQLLREMAGSPGGKARGEASQVSRRDIRTVRAWLPKSSVKQLQTVAALGLHDVAHRLVQEHGHAAETVSDPTVEQLEAMLAALEPFEARLALFGLVLGSAMASKVAMEHEELLVEAADRIPVPRQPADAEPTQAPMPRNAEALEEAVAGLRARAQMLTGLLGTSAAAVAEGRVPPRLGELVDAMDSWHEERGGLRNRIAEMGHDWPEGSGFAELDAVVALVREEGERGAAEVREKIAKLTAQAVGYQDLLAESDDPVDAELLTGLLARTREKLAELGASPPDGSDLLALAHKPDAAAPGPGTAGSPASESPPISGSRSEAAPGRGNVPAQQRGSGPGSGTESVAQESPDARLADEPEKELSQTPPTREPESPDEGNLDDAVKGPPGISLPATGAATEGGAEPADASAADGAAAAGAGTPEKAPRGERITLPWSEEPPSALKEFIAAGRLDEAYWLTAASDECEARLDALAFAAAAFACTNEAEASAVLMAHDRAPEKYVEDREAHLVAVTAALCAGLTAGWPSALVTGYTAVAGLPERWQGLMTALVTAVRQCRRLEAGAGRLATEPGTEQTRIDIGVRARQLTEELPRRTVKYQRGTRALQRMASRDGALGRTLALLCAWADGAGSAEGLESEAEQYRRPQADLRMIEEADRGGRTPKQAKEEIHSGARRQLQGAVASVSELLEMACSVSSAAARQNAAPEADSDLAPAIRSVLATDLPSGTSGAVLGLLLDRLRGETPGVSGPVGLLGEERQQDTGNTPSTDCLLVLADLRRGDGGAPVPLPGAVDLISSLIEGTSADGALVAYLSTGDLHLARQLVGAMAAGRIPAAGSWDEARIALARRDVEDSGKHWGERLRRQLAAVSSKLAQVRTLNLLDPYEERKFTGLVQELAGADEDGQHRAALARVKDLAEQLTLLTQKFADKLRADLASLTVAPADRARISSLLGDGDTVTAEEFLSFARRGEPLPERTAETGEELRAFLAAVGDAKAPGPAGQGVSARWWGECYAAGAALTPGAEQGLAAWDALCDPTRRSMEWQRHIPDVMRLMGLECEHLGARNSERPTRGVQRLRVRATSSEARPGYVAALGSRATVYTVLLISEEQRTESGPLAHLDDADLGSNIILYLHPLGAAGRRKLAEASRGRTQQALVVDPAAVGWIAARAPRSFRSLQRITLPWAGYNPYTPFLAGLVPPEVFYGRDAEMAQVMDPQGGLFLYGGRQLGKSSLLRQATEVFPRRNTDHVAIYLDLLKAEIGQAEPPERIWGVLVEMLKRRKVLGPKVSDRAGAKVVSECIRKWLQGSPTRRLLVLADEADAFLTADSRPAHTSGGQSTFPTVMKLQQLMEETNRHFKVVFAGLHQVQRFGQLSNVSVVHGGPSVLVGPLSATAALRLVVEPMSALGYTFDRPELVWRVLAATNYQANLVQIFCYELVKAMHTRPVGADGRRAMVSEEDVQSVAASDVVRQRIAERLRFTINLEDRYRVLALVIALWSIEDGYAGGYTSKELLDRAREVWHEGFAELSAGQVRIYLEEMEGLGLLIRLSDQRHFAVRSPNVVNMLGTREELAVELEETEFGLPYDYNPRVARRLLALDSEGVARFSPLTEGQLFELLRGGVTVVPASALFQPTSILRTISAYAESRGAKVIKHDASDDLRRTVADAARLRIPHVILADLRGVGSGPLPVKEAAQRLLAHTGPGPTETLAPSTHTRAAVILADPVPVAGLSDGPLRISRPERWTVDTLRSWPECPFGSLDERRRLIAATGGWPHHVERVISLVSRSGATLDAALNWAVTQTADFRPARIHLERSGLSAPQLSLLTVWSAHVEESERVGTADVAAVLELSVPETEILLARLSDLELLDQDDTGVALDAVTFRALTAVAAENGRGLG